jgi:hypothetical protein
MEHFIVDDDEADPRPKSGQQLAASSLQSPDDPVATYRHKAGEDFVGYVANLTETCHPDNPLQLVLLHFRRDAKFCVSTTHNHLIHPIAVLIKIMQPVAYNVEMHLIA